MKTEKISVNLSATELGQIDFLVERGLFDNRSDFMRTAARKALEGHETEFKQFLEIKGERFYALGITHISKHDIQAVIEKGEKMKIRVVGALNFSKFITSREIMLAVESCKVYGKLSATAEVKEALSKIHSAAGS